VGGWVYGVCFDIASHHISHKYQCPEGRAAISFCIHSKVDVLVDNVWVVKESLHASGP
jgi:hypothetical protein